MLPLHVTNSRLPVWFALPGDLVLPSGVDQICQAITDHAGDQQRCKRILVDVLRQVFTRTLPLPIEHIARRACLLARLIADIANPRFDLLDSLAGPGGFRAPFRAMIERVLSQPVALAPTENLSVQNICCKERLPFVIAAFGVRRDDFAATAGPLGEAGVRGVVIGRYDCQ